MDASTVAVTPTANRKTRSYVAFRTQGTRNEIARFPGMENPKVQPAMGDGAKQLLAKIIGDGKLFDEPWRPEEKSDYQRPERRPGPFAQDRDPGQLRNPGAS